MTSDTPTGDQAATENGSTSPRRATRRRVTRPAASPQTAPAPIIVPGSAAQAAPDAAPAAEPTTSAPAQPEPGTTRTSGSTASGAGKKPRRATRRTAGPAAPVADAAADAPVPAEPAAVDDEPAAAEPASAVEPPEPAAAPAVELPEPAAAARTEESRAARLSLDDIVLPDGPGTSRADDGGGEEPTAPARRRSRKASRPASKPESAEQPAAADDAAAGREEPAAPSDAPSEEPKARTSRTKSSTSRAAASADTPAKAPKSSKTAKASTTKASAAKASTSRTGTAQRDQDTVGQAGTPRLATTALLFQAPDLSGPRASRRAQAPAGPPREHEETTARESAPAPGSADAAETTSSGTAASGRRRSASRPQGASGRGARTEAATAGAATTDGPTPDEPEKTATPAEPVEAQPLELTEADEAAVSEVEVIESELTAEGLELVELGPEDYREDGDESDVRPRRRRRRGGRGRRGGRKVEQGSEEDGDEGSAASGDDSGAASDRGADRRDGADAPSEEAQDDASSETEQASGSEKDDQGDGGDRASSSRRRRRRRRGGRGNDRDGGRSERAEDEVVALKGSTRLEAKRQRRREGRDAGRRRQVISEAEFLARREAVTRSMIVREQDARTQIAVLEDGVLVEHYVSQQAQASMVGNVYLGRVQNVLPSMEAAFVDVGKGRNAVLYAGEVNWDAAGIEGQPRRIEEALKSGDSVLVQVTKDPIGHKGARLTSQVTLAGRYLVFVPGGGMTGISRKLPDTERSRLKKILRDVVPEGAGVIVRTAAEGASEDELRADVARLQSQWESITATAEKSSTNAPALLQGEADMAIRVVRDIFNDDFSSLVVQGERSWSEISTYVDELAPDLRERVTRWTGSDDVFAQHRVDEQLAKGMDRKVWLPSGGSLVIDRTEAMTVVDVNTGKFTGSGGTLEETVTRNNLEAAEEIVRQLRLRDIGGIIVIDFVDMVLESNRDLVLRRLVECLGRDRTKHQVAEVTSLGLVQMTRKRVGQGLVEAFSSTCEHCKGRGFVVHEHPVERGGSSSAEGDGGSKRSRRKRGTGKKDDSSSAGASAGPAADVPKLPDDKSEARAAVKATLATIAAAAAHAHEHEEHEGAHTEGQSGTTTPAAEVTAPQDSAAGDAPSSTTAADSAAEATAEAAGAPEPESEATAEAAPDPDAAASATDAGSDGTDAGPAGAEPAKGAGAEEAPEQADDEAAALTDRS
ncbi:Rne/Rng family ribonuclease [Isoptericola aurantiacus]|uniref:Rne/Rng family ribonuclease n=1 Tax=Isoptericola aurantiacus TaxID=3377839 RepID=UPI00383B25B2